MPLKNSDQALAKALQDSMKTAKTYDEAWQKFAGIIIAHFVANAVVVGTAPSGGGPIAEGKVQ